MNYLVASTDYPSFYKVMVRAAKKVRAKEYDGKVFFNIPLYILYEIRTASLYFFIDRTRFDSPFLPMYILVDHKTFTILLPHTHICD